MAEVDEARQRRIIRRMKLREISAVDSPAQVHARVLILKRHESEGIPMNIHSMTRGAAEAALDRLAASIAESERISTPRAVAKALETQTGRQLYRQLRHGPADAQEDAARKRASAGRGNAEDALDRLAKGYQNKNPGTSYAKAYEAVLMTDAGREAYRDVRAAVMAG